MLITSRGTLGARSAFPIFILPFPRCEVRLAIQLDQVGRIFGGVFLSN